MNKVYICLAIACFALTANAESGDPKKKDQNSSFQSTETFTYSLPNSFSAESTDSTQKAPQDQEQRQKLIENIRKLYHAKFI